MPYIDATRRIYVNPLGGMNDQDPPQNAGELNYCITVLLTQYITVHGLRYQYINDVLGALEGAKQEFYRRVAALYEDKKIQENGDVY
jgi:hypothetical protein